MHQLVLILNSYLFVSYSSNDLNHLIVNCKCMDYYNRIVLGEMEILYFLMLVLLFLLAIPSINENADVNFLTW